LFLPLFFTRSLDSEYAKDIRIKGALINDRKQAPAGTGPKKRTQREERLLHAEKRSLFG